MKILAWDSFFWSQPRITLELIGTTVKLMQVVGLVGMHRPVAKNTRVTWSTDVRFLPARKHPWTLLQDVFLELLLVCGCYTYIIWGICNYTCTVYIYIKIDKHLPIQLLLTHVQIWHRIILGNKYVREHWRCYIVVATPSLLWSPPRLWFLKGVCGLRV